MSDAEKSNENQRPYPEGIAWDEAYRQRQKAEALEEIVLNPMPIFDVIERLLEKGCKFEKTNNLWYLIDSSGYDLSSGQTFRKLCVNIILAGH